MIIDNKDIQLVSQLNDIDRARVEYFVAFHNTWPNELLGQPNDMSVLEWFGECRDLF